MALRRLSTAEMVQLSGPWVEKGGPLRPLIEAIPEAASILPRVEQAHAELSDLQPSSSEAELARLTTEATRIDDRHDDLVRGIHAVLTGFASLVDDPRAAEELLGLRDRLFPGGLGLVQRTYREEAAEAVRVADRLSARDRELLATLPLPKSAAAARGLLQGSVDQWLATAKQLGEVEERRAGLIETQQQTPRAAVADSVLARNHWMRAVQALVSGLELGALDAAVQARLLGPLREAERIADRRVGLRE